MFWHEIARNNKIKTLSCHAQSGFTFLEIVISLFVLTVGAFSMLQVVNVAMQANYRAQQEVIASKLAAALSNEIMSKDFEEPGLPDDDPIAVEGGEVINQRTDPSGINSFDDVDDYDGYNDGPASTIAPLTIGNFLMNGADPLPDCRGFTRSVTVRFVESVDVPPVGDLIFEYQDRGTFFPTKRFIVTVNGPGVGNFQLEGIKTQ